METNLIFLDTETTGIENGRLIQLAYKRRGDGHVFVENYKPPIPIEIEAMATHHLTERMVADKAPFKDSESQKMLAEMLKKSVLVAHNARFDMEMLAREGIPVKNYICTWRVAETLYDLPNYKMQYLRYLWGIEIPEAHAHSAEGDVMVLQKIFDHMVRDYSLAHGTANEEIVEKFMEFSSKPLLLKRATFGKYAGKTFEEIKAADMGYLQWMATLKDKDEDFLYTVNHHLGKMDGTGI